MVRPSGVSRVLKYPEVSHQRSVSMKVARMPDSKQPITAAKTAPAQAVCPHCGGAVTLRQRKRMNSGDCTYFWRHQDNRDRACSSRSHPTRG